MRIQSEYENDKADLGRGVTEYTSAHMNPCDIYVSQQLQKNTQFQRMKALSVLPF